MNGQLLNKAWSIQILLTTTLHWIRRTQSETLDSQTASVILFCSVLVHVSGAEKLTEEIDRTDNATGKVFVQVLQDGGVRRHRYKIFVKVKHAKPFRLITVPNVAIVQRFELKVSLSFLVRDVKRGEIPLHDIDQISMLAVQSLDDGCETLVCVSSVVDDELAKAH